jgi:hypothetical protein
MALYGAYPELMAATYLYGPSIASKSPQPMLEWHNSQDVTPRLFGGNDDPSIVCQLTDVSLDEAYTCLLRGAFRRHPSAPPAG